MQSYTHTSTSSDDAKLLPKRFLFFFKSSVSFKFTEKKAVNTMLSFYYVQLSCAFREAV